MSTETVRIVGGVIDTTKFTMYKEDGSTIVLKQGDPRLAPLLSKVMQALDYAPYVDIQLEELKVENDYEEFEKKSSGIVSFFRVAKAKLKSLFQPELIPATAGVIPAFGVDPEAAVANTHTAAAVAEIMQHAQPVSAKDFDESHVAQQANVVEESGKTLSDAGDLSASDTIVAVVDGKIIPGVEKIKSQIARAAKMGSTEGIDLFMLRIAGVIEKRQHSVEDLMRFLERGDLPIADDGSILIYKLLFRNGNKNGKPTYVDCHSRSVEQWVGAYVCMDEKRVDHNRRQECSNGLHVARRGYLSGFSGDVCVLAKLAPEDVIAVPHGDANKMRVCGYHIIAELTDEMRAKLQSNKPITDTTEGQKILATALRGDHIGKTHEVRVTGAYGKGVVVKPLEQPVPYVAPAPAPEVKAEAPAEAETPVVLPKPIVEVALENPGENLHGEVVDPNAVIAAQTATLSRKDQAKALYDAWFHATDMALKCLALELLVDFKKAAKVGWDRLGIPDPADASLGADKKASTKKVKIPTKVVQKATVYTAEVDLPKPPKVDTPAMSTGSFKDRIQKLLSIGKMDKAMAQKVYDLKKQSKKSWEVLGVNSLMQDNILRWIGK